MLARAGQARQLRQQRRLHRLEQDDRDSSEEEPGDERGDLGVLRAGGEDGRDQDRRVAQALGEDGPAQQVPEVGRELRPRRLRARLDEPVLLAQGEQTREGGRDGEAQAVRDRVGDAGEPQDGRRQESDA